MREPAARLGGLGPPRRRHEPRPAQRGSRAGQHMPHDGLFRVFPTTDQGGPLSDIWGDRPPQDPVQSLCRTRMQVEAQAQLLCGDQRRQSPALSSSRAGSRRGRALSRNQGGPTWPHASALGPRWPSLQSGPPRGGAQASRPAGAGLVPTPHTSGEAETKVPMWPSVS